MKIIYQTLTFILVLQFWSLSSYAQETKVIPSFAGAQVEKNAGTKSPLITSPLAGEITHQHVGDKWAVSVRPTSSRNHFSEEVKQIKESKRLAKENSYQPSEENITGSRAVNPKMGVNFEANWSVESHPPDNTIAVSNGGFVVTANNDGVEYYTTTGNFLYFDFWPDFFNDNNLTASFFDPKVIYDSGSDRFILIVLHGSSASTSKVLVCFSKTNNPQNGWWVYTLTGNPLNNNCWFDYPNIGISNNELYVTGNLFAGSFNQAILYQIPKAAGYAGGNLDWQYWANLSTTPYKGFGLVPASYGHQGNYGPGIYLVSNETFGENRIRFWDLTDDMSGTPQLDAYTVSTTTYSPAADAYQSGSEDRLDNGDCRIQNAFYLDGIVHYVFHSDIGEGWNGINYNRLNVNTTTNESSTFGLQGSYDYSYPAVVPFSTAANDRSVMIAFLRSSEDTYPQVRVVNCDQNLVWSPSLQIKAGETFVDFLSEEERWGDYTGIARKHNQGDPRIWVAGCYGADIPGQGTFNTYKTWVAEIQAGEPVSTDDEISLSKLSVFPNPTYDFLQVRFMTEQREEITIELFDNDGRLVKQLYQDVPRTGENKLTFNKGVLSPGTYYLHIRSHTSILKNEKIIMLD